MLSVTAELLVANANCTVSYVSDVPVFQYYLLLLVVPLEKFPHLFVLHVPDIFLCITSVL